MNSNNLSQTAAFIAIKFYGLTQDKEFRSFFDESTLTFYERIVKNLPSPLRFYYPALSKRWVRSFFISSEEWMLPGDLMHILMRKYYITKTIKKLQKYGFDQIVVAGAGFDHISALFSNKNMDCLELDTDRMSNFKHEFLTEYDYNNRHLELLAIHPEKSLLSQKILTRSILSPNKKTIVLAEGFFDYLPKKRVKTFLKNISSFFNNDIALVSTIFDLSELSFLRRWVFKRSVALVGEPLKLHLTVREFRDIVDDFHFSDTGLISYRTMEQQKLYPSGISMPVLKGFYLLHAICEKDHKKN